MVISSSSWYTPGSSFTSFCTLAGEKLALSSSFQVGRAAVTRHLGFLPSSFSPIAAMSSRLSQGAAVRSGWSGSRRRCVTRL